MKDYKEQCFTMKLNSPVRMVETDQAGFHVSGWKSLIDKHNLQQQATQSKASLRQFMHHPYT